MYGKLPSSTGPGARRQQGAVLAIALIILLVMTLIGVMSLQTTTFEERMAGNMRDIELAFEAAEAALLAAQEHIEDNIIALDAFDTDGADGLYDDSVEEIWDTVDWSCVAADAGCSAANRVREYDTFDSTYNVSQTPRYVIQHYATVTQDADVLNLDNYGQGTGAGEVELFRITVLGTGGSPNSRVVLQVTYGKVL